MKRNTKEPRRKHLSPWLPAFRFVLMLKKLDRCLRLCCITRRTADADATRRGFPRTLAVLLRLRLTANPPLGRFDETERAVLGDCFPPPKTTLP